MGKNYWTRSYTITIKSEVFLQVFFFGGGEDEALLFYTQVQ